jgi:hypothetical protein
MIFLLGFSFHKSPEFEMGKEKRKRNETIISCYVRVTFRLLLASALAGLAGRFSGEGDGRFEASFVRRIDSCFDRFRLNVLTFL